MNGKKVFSFLVLKPAWSTRNLTSLALVALFFGVYVAAGGKITAVPKVKQGSGFGTINDNSGSLDSAASDQHTAAQDDEPIDLDNGKTIARPAERKPLSLEEENFSLKPKRVEERPIVKSQSADPAPAVANKTGEPADDLSDIEARLNINRKGSQ